VVPTGTNEFISSPSVFTPPLMDIEDLSEDVWDTEGISGKPLDTCGISGQLLSTRGASEKLGLSFLSHCACKALVLPESARPATSTTTEQSSLAGFG